MMATSVPRRDQEVRSLSELLELEQAIAAEVRRYPLDRLLLSLRAKPQPLGDKDAGWTPHIVGVAVRFALRYGSPGPLVHDTAPFIPLALGSLLRLVAKFAYADPIAWDTTVDRSTLSIMLRHVGNQLPFRINTVGRWARSQILYVEIPGKLQGLKEVPPFDFRSKFRTLTGVDPETFIDLGYVTYSAAASKDHLGFSRGYFEKARQLGFKLPDHATVQHVLNRYALDSTGHEQKARECEQKQNRAYAAYDYSPLFVYPLVRPWPSVPNDEIDLDRMIAPVPDLVLYRLSTGIYFDMHHEWGKPFDDWFGHLLSTYVGRMLRSFIPAGSLISEKEIRTTYGSERGKAPDWIIIDGRTAVLLEVKVARIQRKVYATGDLALFSKCLEPFRIGLRQIHEFQSAAAGKAVGLESLHRCREYVAVVVTFEPTYLANSTLVKDLIRSGLPASMQTMNWASISLDDVEWAETHLSGGEVDVASFFRHLMTAQPHEVIDAAAKHSKRNYGDSALWRKEEELYGRLGIAELLDERTNV